MKIQELSSRVGSLTLSGMVATKAREPSLPCSLTCSCYCCFFLFFFLSETVIKNQNFLISLPVLIIFTWKRMVCFTVAEFKLGTIANKLIRITLCFQCRILFCFGIQIPSEFYINLLATSPTSDLVLFIVMD